MRQRGSMADAPPVHQAETMKPGSANVLRTVLILAAVCLLAVFVYLSAYNNDNKYSASQPRAVSGVLALDNDTLETHPVLFLISGWEYYGGDLLSPGDFLLPIPCRYVYIGQYGGFEAGDKGAPPHGSATYRINILVPEKPREYMLELPEIFSAYRAYINGEAAVQMGDPEPASYRPETGSRVLTFTAGGRIEVIVAATDFTHLYSGMTYPPMFGMPDKVAGILNTRLMARSAVCAVALGVALLSILIGLLSHKRRLTFLYAILCICFIGYVSYPIRNTVSSSPSLSFALENTSFCAVLLIAMCIQYTINGIKDNWSRYFFIFGALCCSIAGVLPFISYLNSVTIMYGYSLLISAYEYITAGYLTFMAVRAVVKKTAASLTLLGGIAMLDIALIMDRLLPLYEPIRTGWFIEIAGFVLVLAIGAAIGQDVAATYRESAVLAERANSMERLSDMQRGYYAVLKQEMAETRTARHDLHHHFTAMKGFLQGKQYDELASYITSWQGPVHYSSSEAYSDNNVINILAHHYSMLCEQNQIFIEARCELNGPVRVSDADLCGVLSNLLENAVEACLRIQAGRRAIRLGITDLGDDLNIHIENSTDGNITASGDSFLSSKGEGRTGYGLASVRAVAKRYNGTASFTWDREGRIFTSIVVL